MFHVVLFQPEIPHNTGAVGRTCVALGAKLWLIKPLGFLIDDKNLRRCGIDYWPHLEWEAVDDWSELERRLGPPTERPYWFFTKSGVKSYNEAAFADEDVFVYGRESSGLPVELTDAYPERCLRIPIKQPVRSLNVSVCAGITLFEAKRQIGFGIF